MLAPTSLIKAFGDAEIGGLTADSRATKPGFLFAALSGSKTTGTRFIEDALQRGAGAILADVAVAQELAARGIPALGSDNPRLALSLIAAQFYPRQPDVIAAITGTNGKTSVANFARQLWQGVGRSSASLGTLGAVAQGFTKDLGHTTPDPVMLHQTLAELTQIGVSHLALEASSHGLDQYRLDGIRICAAAITNITRDHLDYHGTFEDYVNAKMRLFADLLPNDGFAVINADSANVSPAQEIVQRRAIRLISVGEAGSDLRLLARTPHAWGQELLIGVGGKSYPLQLPLVGAFQASNLLVAMGFLYGLGEPMERVIAAVATLDGVPGRMERAANLSNGASIIVDYAHTPDALATVLAALRPHVSGKLVVAFGCGGDRDRGKRPQMGAIAAGAADLVIVTDDNPRSENPDLIRREIIQGIDASGTQAQIVEIGDRAEAIAYGVAHLSAGDILLIAGKGHESGQIIGETVHPFDDRDVARAAAVGQ